MMFFSDSKSFGSTLADRHGVWCAWCLEYIDPEHLQAHHVVSRAYIRRYYGPGFPQGWTIPAHDHCCHLPVLQTFSGGVESYLQTLQLGPFSFSELDRSASQFHQAGLYWLSILLKEHMRRKMIQHGNEPESEENWSRIEDILRSASGARMASRLPGALIQSNRPPLRADLLLNLANFHSNYGHLPTAKRWLRAAEDTIARLPRRSRDKFRASEARRITQVLREKSTGYEAIQLSKSSHYSINTAYVLTAWIELSEGHYNRARDLFENVLHCSGVLTWLYKAESWFGFAMARLGQGDNLTEAFKLLVRAQYIYILLGIQGTPHPEVFPGHSSHPSDLMPGDILVNAPAFECFNREQCLEMRREVILGEQLFWKLNDLLSGRTLV